MNRVILPLTADRSRVIEMISRAPDGYVVEIREPSRSLEQNALYWATIHEIAESVKVQGAKFTPQVWHIYFKQRFLPGRIIELPNGQIMESEPTTTELTKEEFSEFIENVLSFKENHQ
jgi:2,4-dienoyl-CoA reductase-like NADH-dependent reductase (Old Yellow Enzyme family)